MLNVRRTNGGKTCGWCSSNVTDQPCTTSFHRHGCIVFRFRNSCAIRRRLDIQCTQKHGSWPELRAPDVTDCTKNVVNDAEMQFFCAWHDLVLNFQFQPATGVATSGDSVFRRAPICWSTGKFTHKVGSGHGVPPPYGWFRTQSVIGLVLQPPRAQHRRPQIHNRTPHRLH